MDRTDSSLRSNRHDGRQAGKRQERIRAHGTTGRVAGAAREMLSGSQPSSSTACPAYVLPRAPIPMRPTLASRPDGTAGTLSRAVSSQEVVGGGDQPPLGPDGGSPSASEAVDAAVELGVGKDRLDDRLALAVELAAALAGEDSAHERIRAAVPTWAGAFAAFGVGRDQHRNAAIDDPLHLLLVPIARIGKQHLRNLRDAGGVQLALGGV